MLLAQHKVESFLVHSPPTTIHSLPFLGCLSWLLYPPGLCKSCLLEGAMAEVKGKSFVPSLSLSVVSVAVVSATVSESCSLFKQFAVAVLLPALTSLLFIDMA